MVWILLTLLLLSTAFGFAASFYLLRFARIIFIIEEDLSGAVEALEKCAASFDKVLNTSFFFESPHLRPIIADAIEEIKLSKLEIQSVIKKFTQRKKQKYIQIIEESEDEDET